MSENLTSNSEADSSQESLVRLFAQTAFTVFILVTTVVLFGIYARQELVTVSEWVIQKIGYPGLFFGMLISDSLPAFVPPDAFLILSIAAEMDPIWVIFTCSLGSIIGGSISYCVGRYLIPRFSLGRRLILKYEDKLVPMIRRYGFWAVVLSAMTPVPYSWMAYTVGSFRMKFYYFFGGSLFRILRMTVYFYAMLWGWL
ncbi:YqaA family protein [Leptospira sp. GIMC2001]|uniref:YqaA family protein n=1 Tax=Leptospira sp. GIMC2001 TaxID=1513297 RepID=UPI00234BE7EC|nr:VTT domain-containing protein [Leptospira sp. GIMC2001]WCL48200.1 VTT domain-containing protein [Leptospira sp. GIMC2001]